jgi:Ca-activated chloride channel family protein
MCLFGVLLASGPSLAIAGPVQTTTGSDDTTFTLNVNVDLVELQVLALDGQGRHVTTLGQSDFLITEDGIEQRISLFRQNDLPVSLGLVIDNSRSMLRKKDRVDVAALSFISHNNPDDEAFLIHFDDTARLAHGFTQDPEPIRQTLGTIQPYGQTALYDAVALSLEAIEGGEYKQKAILVISDGADNASATSFERVLELVRESEATLYTIGVFRNRSVGEEARPMFEALAEAGGGRAFFPNDASEVSALTLQIAQEIRDQYTLGYVPSNFQHDGTWRSVRVWVRPELRARNIQLNYRHGYYAPQD